MLRAIAIATAVAGTLDILFASILTIAFGRNVGDMLRYVGSGPFPQASGMGASGAALGLVVHFTLIAVMAAVFMIAARRFKGLRANPALSGLIYGLLTYVVMNLLVVPLRFDTPFPPKPLSIATQLFAHIVLVGLPIALVAARWARPRER